MATFKTFDVYCSAGSASLTDDSATTLKLNKLEFEPILGEVVLFRFSIYESDGNTDTYTIADGDGLEFIVSDKFNASESEILVYSHTRDFQSGDWADFSRSGGKVSARVNFNTSKLKTKVGSNDNVTDTIAELVLTPAGTDQHVTLAQFAITIRNQVYPSTANVDVIDLFPPAESSSASVSSSSAHSSSSSASSTSESSANSSSSTSSVSQSSTSESSERSSLSSSESTQALPSSQSSTSESSANSSSSQSTQHKSTSSQSSQSSTSEST